MKNLTAIEFKKNLFKINDDDYTFIGERPCIIDFYADWCQPCKITQVVLNQLEKEYKGIDFFKVDAENEYELVELFGVKNLPTMVLVNMNNDVKIQTGFIAKPKLEKLISETFKIKNTENIKESL